jgi:hypothetical protein
VAAGPQAGLGMRDEGPQAGWGWEGSGDEWLGNRPGQGAAQEQNALREASQLHVRWSERVPRGT